MPAHLTLFHAVPEEHEARLRADLAAACAARGPVALWFDRVLAFSRGVAFGADAPGLVAVRAGLARAWEPWLSDQDRRPLRPHVTVQNKVAPEVAQALHARLAREFAPFAARAVGLELWRYRGGRWDPAGRSTFRS